MAINLKTLQMDHFVNVNDDNAFLVSEDLGPLSNWWMKKEVFNQAKVNREFNERSVRPMELSSKPGSCWPIFALENACPALRDAMLLPCIWKKGPNGQGLPQKLKDLAAQVIDAIADADVVIRGAKPGDYKLHFDNRLAGIDLDDSVFPTVGSAWVSLAGGLISAMSGLSVSTSVWASSAMDVRTGAMEIGLLEKKMELAASASDIHGQCKKFFVSTANQADALKYKEKNKWSLEICALEQFQGNDLATVLQPYLSECLSEPAAPSEAQWGDTTHGSFRQCAQFFLFLKAHSDRSTQYYRSHIVPSLEKSLQKQMSGKAGFRGCSHYVGVLSRSPELVVLGSAAVKAEHILILHDGSLSNELNYVKKTLKARFGKDEDKVDLAQFSSETPIESVVRAVEQFVNDAEDPTKVVIDIKPATKKLTYALLKAAKPQHRILCIQEKENGPNDRRPVPGEEVLEFLDR